MIIAHDAHGGSGTWLPAVTVAMVALGYLVLAARRRRDGRGWSALRTGAFVAGAILLGVAFTPSASPFPRGDFRGHMLQHLIIGMLAPIGLVLGTPITLILRSVPTRWGRMIGRILRSPAAHVVAHPVTALALTVGGVAVVYFTPVYAATISNPILHHLVHAHFLVAGYLFAWAIAGRDPAPRRPSAGARIVVLAVAIAAHATFAQLMYGGLFVQVPAPAEERRAAADLMYYGGDTAELLLALALLTSWRPGRRVPTPQRTAGRIAATPSAG